MDASTDVDNEAPEASETTPQSALQVVTDTTMGVVTGSLGLTSSIVLEPTTAGAGVGVNTTMDICKYRNRSQGLSSSIQVLCCQIITIFFWIGAGEY